MIDSKFLQNGKCIGDKLFVRFDKDHNRLIPLGNTGIKLIRPDEWLHKDDEGKQTFAENTNYLETKPQICEVLIQNENYPYKVGDKLFTHYMAWETAKCGDLITNEAFIIGDYVFLTILPDGTYKMTDDNYIGEQVYTEEKVRPSGLIVDIGGKKELMRIKLTHLPQNPPYENKESPVKIGDTVVSIDPYNYEFTLDSKKYVRLKWSEIAGIAINEAPGIKPLV